MPIGSGPRDRLITIERATETRDKYNNLVPGAWAELTQEWASKEDVRDAERMRAQQVGSDISTRFQVLSNDVTRTITTKDRINYDGLTYDIVAVKEIRRDDGIELTGVART